VSLPPSEFEVLCADGGPVPLSETVDRSALAWACQQFHFNEAWATYRDWEPDEVRARRYWPWVALSAAQYQFEREEKAKYADEPKPSELTALMNGIATGANSLGNDLTRLQVLSYRLGEAETPERRQHLAWMRAYIAQSLAAGPRGEVDEADTALGIAAFAAIPEFCKRLAWLEMAAREAVERISPELLRRSRPQSDRGLGFLVAHASIIWEPLTERPASVNKVTRKGCDERPDFAIFVANIAKLACGNQPTLHEIATAFRRLHTRNSAKSKSL
jgi:hypothetical protein